MQLFFSLYCLLYTDSKLFCIKLLCLDLFLTVFLYSLLLCPFPEPTVAEGLSHAPGWVGWIRLEMAGTSMGQPWSLLTEATPQPPLTPPGQGHLAWWPGIPKSQKAAPGNFWLPGDFCNHEGKLSGGECHPSHGEFLNMPTQHQMPILQLGFIVIIVFPAKQGASISLLYFSVGHYTYLVGCYILSHQWFSSVRRGGYWWAAHNNSKHVKTPFLMMIH